jgi:molybdenum cofactor cytidylyltransferase
VKLKIGVIILAAGNSSRMCGESKQLLKFQGKTLLRLVAETALRTAFSTVVVLGSKHELFRKEIEDMPLKIVFNENWEVGISSSIKRGLSALAEDDLKAAIVMLCDQPLVTSEVLMRLKDSFIESKKPIVACSYENTIGVPALFAREIFDELNNLQNDEGAKKIIVEDLNRTVLVTVPEAAFDVDTLQDFEKLKILTS